MEHYKVGQMTPVELLDLLKSAQSVPTRMVLDRTLKKPPEYRGWAIGGHAFFFSDPAGLTITRNGRELHVHRDGVDLLRRAAGRVWQFDGPVPVEYRDDDIGVPGPLGGFLGFVDSLSELSDFDAAQVREGSIAGRDVLIVPLDEVILSLDAEHGVILGVENDMESVFATSVDFLNFWDSPVWGGPVTEPEREPEPAGIPPITLPPAPTRERDLRVLCTQEAMEGEIPDWKPGDTVRLELSFTIGSPPLEGLQSTRRGRLIPEKLLHRGRTYTFLAHGWAARVFTRTPLPEDVELSGYFIHCTYTGFETNTYVVITAVYRHGSDTIIDATLDGAVLPPIQPATDGSCISDGEILWIASSELPLVRGFSLSDGKLLHELTIPTWDHIYLEKPDKVTAGEKHWQLPGLEKVEAPERKEPPPGWEQPQKHTNNLYSLWAELGPDLQGGTCQALMTLDPFQLVSLDLDGFTISNAYRFGDRIYAETMHHVIVLSLALEVEQIYTNHGFFTPHPDAPQMGTPAGELICFEDAEIFSFHDPLTTNQLVDFVIPDGFIPHVVVGEPDRIVISLENKTSRLHKTAWVWESDSGWRECRLVRPLS